MARNPKKESPDPEVLDGEDGLGKRHAFWIATMMLVSMATFIGGFCIIGYSYLKYQYIHEGPVTAEQVFEIPRGAGLSTIASRLEKDGIIKSDFIFKIFIKLDDGETSLKAGEYSVPAGASMRDVYDILRDGKAILYPFTVAEGLTSAQIMRQIIAADMIAGEAPSVPAEGTLLPETYMLPKTMTKRQLVLNMSAAQTAVIDELWENRADDLPIKTKAEAMILASIVEKETGVHSERKRVAAVFINRLNKGMRLESDPTIIYGITGGEKLGRGLRRSEIDRKTDWNTYQINGLPKTPICNPGYAAIESVLHPLETDEIFFVADGTGGHAFAATLAGHNANVRAWRRIERDRKRSQ